MQPFSLNLRIGIDIFMQVFTETRDFSLSNPIATLPTELRQIERWHQLDATALCFALLAIQLLQKKIPLPQAMLLASPGASNEADADFFSQGMDSPQKFAHTLPNLRIHPVCEILQWCGPVLCIQKGEESFIAALKEASLLFSKWNSIWVWGVKKKKQEPQKIYEALTFTLTQDDRNLLYSSWILDCDEKIWSRYFP